MLFWLCCILPAVLGQIKPIPGLTYKTFRSAPVALRSGQISNTSPLDFPNLDWVNQSIAIHSFVSDIVDENDKSVPLSELYIHHWVVYATEDKQSVLHAGGPCKSLMNVFGIGAELRHSTYEFPEEYAVITTGKETWYANLHYIRTTNTPDPQSCLECRCKNSEPPLHNRGEVGCCPDRGMCYGMHNSTLNDTKNYYLKYTIGYRVPTKEIKPITTFGFDITASHTYDCKTDFQIPALAPGMYQLNSSVSDIPTDIDAVVFGPHIHIGGEWMAIEHLDSTGKYIETLCNATAMYGTGGLLEAGNETGYIVGIPFCTYTTPKRLPKGNKLRLTTLYSGRTIAGGHNWHSGVMGVLFLFGEDVGKHNTDQCVPTLHSVCNPPPYMSTFQCQRCAQRHASILDTAGCNNGLIQTQCAITGGQGNIPAPVPDMSLTFNPVNGPPPYHVSVSAPQGTWFGIAWNANSPTMQGATAWVLEDPGTGTPVVQKRALGNHYAGSIVQTMDANITTEGSTTTFTILLGKADIPTGEYNCVLFARGDSLRGTSIQYHGSNRGFVCDI